jgi:CHRD domain-containing protein
MRYWGRVIAALAVAGCSGSVSNADRITNQQQSPSILASSVASEEAPPIVFNTQLRSDIESPACETESQGHAQIKILQDGTIESVAILNNKGDESVRFGHIHHMNPAPATTGPIIWWLTSPVGTDLNITDRHFEFRQDGIFVTNPHFTTHAAGLAELLAHPENFYVNFHSDHCPGGIARGFLP